VDVPARTAVALARVVVVGVIAVGIGIVIVIGVVIDIIVSSSRRGGLCRVASFVPPFSDGDPSDRSVMAFPGVLV